MYLISHTCTTARSVQGRLSGTVNLSVSKTTGKGWLLSPLIQVHLRRVWGTCWHTMHWGMVTGRIILVLLKVTGANWTLPDMWRRYWKGTWIIKVLYLLLISHSVFRQWTLIRNVLKSMSCSIYWACLPVIWKRVTGLWISEVSCTRSWKKLYARRYRPENSLMRSLLRLQRRINGNGWIQQKRNPYWMCSGSAIKILFQIT